MSYCNIHCDRVLAHHTGKHRGLEDAQEETDGEDLCEDVSVESLAVDSAESETHG